MDQLIIAFVIIFVIVGGWYWVTQESFDSQIIWAVVNNGYYYSCQLVPNGYQYSPTFDTVDQCYDYCMSKYQSSCQIGS